MLSQTLLEQVRLKPDTINFNDTMAAIDADYHFTATAFDNGDTHNAAGQNNGSCKLFAFAKLQQLDTHSTLALFGDYYRIDVLQNPEGTDHANIRNFIEHGWNKVVFAGNALTAK